MSCIKFGYQWEDPIFEEKCFNNSKNILLITSGGETLFHLLSKFGNNIESIHCIDFNINQIELIYKKIDDMKHNKNNYHGAIFEHLLSKSLQENNWNENFSNEILIKHFTENAVKYSSESFANHFENIMNCIDKNTHYYEMIKNKKYNFTDKNLYPEYFDNIDIILKNFHKVIFYTDNIITFLNNTNHKYDFINLSNIGDWMNKDSLKNLMNLANNSLNQFGRIIIRRLLSDNIIQETNELKFVDIQYCDKTSFYLQTVCLAKIK